MKIENTYLFKLEIAVSAALECEVFSCTFILKCEDQWEMVLISVHFKFSWLSMKDRRGKVILMSDISTNYQPFFKV